MEIYVVQQGDTIYSIAQKFNTTVPKLIRDNGLNNPEELVVGQTIVIAFPDKTYTVKEGDTLESISVENHISIMQLLRNNPFLTDRENIFPGEDLIISYKTTGQIITNGIAYPFINKDYLLKVLPNLTYLSVFNYRAAEKGEIVAFYDDTEIIQTSKRYGTIPLLLISTLSLQGFANLETSYSLLSNEEYQDNYIENVLNLLKIKGYAGINMVYNYMDAINQSIYQKFIKKVASRIKQEGYLYFAIINPSLDNLNEHILFEKIDYTDIGEEVDQIIFLKFVWGTNYGPPTPVSNITNMKALLNYVRTVVPSDKIIFGNPVISYDWQLPFIQGKSSANSLTVDSALNLAKDAGVAIQFDEISQTPFFTYNQINIGPTFQHIVWSLDARSLEALINVVNEFSLKGIAFWNVMVFYPLLWLMINSQYDIVKLIPEQL
jgi:Predicted glycosyl hydrolase